MCNGVFTEMAIFLGVYGYGTVFAENKDEFEFLFNVEGEPRVYHVSNALNYALQNVLQEGRLYLLTVSGNVVMDAVPAKSVITGVITEINSVSITVRNVRIPIGTDTRIWKIVCRPGGASVLPASLRTGDTVTIPKLENPVRSIYQIPPVQEYIPRVQGVPGVHTLKNFLATAMEPVGTTLYIYGGGWNWQDTASGPQAVTIGVPRSWSYFFQSQDSSYTYKNNADHTKSFYPHNGWNEYYYAGADCSGYVGWAVYNLMNSHSGGQGMVQKASSMAENFAKRGWGVVTKTLTGIDENKFCPGDIFSMSGHVWICLGTCGDGSLVILHSTPSESRRGFPGGGVQISAVGNSSNCEAYRLACRVMAYFFPEWDRRYQAVLKDYNEYTTVCKNASGRFRWNLEGSVLSDPDGYRAMSPQEILEDLFACSAAL